MQLRVSIDFDVRIVDLRAVYIKLLQRLKQSGIVKSIRGIRLLDIMRYMVSTTKRNRRLKEDRYCNHNTNRFKWKTNSKRSQI